MAILLSECRLATAIPAFLGARKIFISFRMRVPSEMEAVSSTIISRASSTSMSIAVRQSTTLGMRAIRLLTGFAPDTGRVVDSVAPIGAISDFAMVYDADDPTMQGAYCNGVFRLLSKTGVSGLGGGLADLRLQASNGVEYEVEELVVGVGVIPTASQVRQLAKLTAANYGVIGDLRAVPGAEVHRWTLRGEVGAPAGAPGDPGTISDGPGAPAFATQLGSASYLEQLDPADQVAFGEPTVLSSGLVVSVPAYYITDVGNTPAKLESRDPSIFPSYRVNGGPPISAIACVGDSGSYEAAASLLPVEGRISPGDSVTWSVPAGWLTTLVGASPEVVDQPVRNRAGMTYNELDAPTMRVGANYTSPGPSYHANHMLQLNRAKNIGPGTYAHKPNGEFTIPLSGLLFHSVDSSTTPKSGRPVMLGLYYVAWTDLSTTAGSDALPCEFSIQSAAVNPRVAPRSEFSRDVLLPDGSTRRIRVFEYYRRREEVQLSEAIDEAATVIPISTFGTMPKANSDYDIVLDIEGETIVARDRGTSPNRLVDCVRGVKGTASAHAQGATGYLSVTQWGGVPSLKLAGTANKIDYVDLVILSPDDWTPPEEGEPTPMLEAASLDLCAEFKRESSEGLGILRFMDSTPVGDKGCEPEDIMKPETASWANGTGSVSTVYTSVRAFIPDANTRVYFRYPVPNAETYPVTLSEPLSAVAAGTRQTIEVEGTTANPILVGSRLLAGNEVIRVISGSGTTWLVERGAGLTTPEAHLAGTIQAGWRLPYLEPVEDDGEGGDAGGGESDGPPPPVDDEGDEEPPPDDAEVDNTVFFELVSDEPNEWPTGESYSLVGQWNDNVNIQARRTGTLTAAVDATQLTFPVSFSNEDWNWIAPGITLVIGNEALLVETVDRDSGLLTITVPAEGSPRPKGAAYGMGEPISTKSGYVLCENAEGTERAWQHVLNYAYSTAVTGPNSIKLHRGAKKWRTCVRPVAGQNLDMPAVSRTRPPRGYPYEMCATAANHANAWLVVNIPGMSTDDFVIEQARRVRDTLDPGGLVFVELANEIWNWGFPTFGPFTDIANWARVGKAADYAVLRSRRVCELYKAVFAEVGRANEVRHYMPWQVGAVSGILATARKWGVDIDATGCAPYISLRGNTATHAEFVNATDDDGACADAWVFFLQHYIGSKSNRRMLEKDARSRAEHVDLTGRPLLMVHYEGGLAATIPQEGVTHARERNRDIRYHPNWYYAELDCYYSIAKFTEADAICVFNNSQGPFGDPTIPNLVEQVWGMNVWWGQKPGYGDGRDGGIDNRQNIFRPGLPQSRTPVDNGDMKDSVRWQAAIDYNKAFFAGEPPVPPDPPEPDPDPGDPDPGPDPDPSDPDPGPDPDPSDPDPGDPDPGPDPDPSDPDPGDPDPGPDPDPGDPDPGDGDEEPGDGPKDGVKYRKPRGWVPPSNFGFRR